MAWLSPRRRARPSGAARGSSGGHGSVRRPSGFRGWRGGLGAAWTRGASGGTPADAGPSVFELLREASREVPGWLEARRRTSLSRGWGGLTVLGLLAGGAGGLSL